MDKFLQTTTGKIVAAVAALFLLIVLLRSCEQPTYVAQQPQVVQPQVMQQAPVMVQSAPSNDGFWTGLMLGHMFGGGGGYGYNHQTTIVHQTVVAPSVTTVSPATPRVQTAVRPQTLGTNSRGITAFQSSTGRISVGRARR